MRGRIQMNHIFANSVVKEYLYLSCGYNQQLLFHPPSNPQTGGKKICSCAREYEFLTQEHLYSGS